MKISNPVDEMLLKQLDDLKRQRNIICSQFVSEQCPVRTFCLTMDKIAKSFYEK
jgi:hypothetical protein